MLSALMTAPAEIDFQEIPIPEVGKDQVLIRVKRIGVCGSDIHVYHGKHRYMTYPVVQGHEGPGIIEKIGEGVKEFSVGDRVTVQPTEFCGKCYQCTHGRNNICEEIKVLGVHSTGMGSEYFLIDQSKVLKLPENMNFDQGAMVEATAVAVHAVRRSGNIEGLNVLVLGAGPIGNLVGQAAKALGANKVMITDINPTRLRIAEKCSIDYTVNTLEESLEDKLIEKFGVFKADVIFDCAAVKSTMEQSKNNARKGSNIVIVGNFNGTVELEMAFFQRREINIIGVMLYSREDFEKAIELIAQDKINTKDLITNYFDLKDYLEAYQFIDANAQTVMKVIIKVSEQK
jgi:L-iditol 2-dehydrogenase